MDKNYYHATRRVDFAAPPLDQDIETEVAIIGGGISGVSAALHLAERGSVSYTHLTLPTKRIV